MRRLPLIILILAFVLLFSLQAAGVTENEHEDPAGLGHNEPATASLHSDEHDGEHAAGADHGETGGGHAAPHEVKPAVVVTQILGFLLVLWILKKYAWKPMLAALDERSERIRNDYDEAAKAREKEEKLVEEYSRKLADIDQLAREKIQSAAEEGSELASSIREEARAEASSILEKARENIDREIASARTALRDEIINLSIDSAEKVIREQLDEPRQKQLISRYLDEIEENLT